MTRALFQAGVYPYLDSYEYISSSEGHLFFSVVTPILTPTMLPNITATRGPLGDQRLAVPMIPSENGEINGRIDPRNYT